MQTQLSTGVDAAPDADALAPGAQAGPWRIESLLGRGGMGAVYAVTHDEIGKRAALKVMHRALISAVAAERILTEARVVNRIGHANIVDIFETGTLDDGRLYIVMERLDGRPLGAVAQTTKLLPDRVIAILLQICDALIAAHAAGVVHRDLKLDNVFLIDNPDGPDHPKVKVLDWGIAKEVARDARQTIEGQLVGTPQYLSPEQARGLDVGPASDVYSLGVLAFELFLEQLPFEAETAAEVMTMHLRTPPPMPSELWPEIPRALEDLLVRMLAKKPVDRPSMLSVARALEAVQADLDARRTAAMEPVPAPPPRFGRSWRIFAGAVALSAATAALGLVHGNGAPMIADAASPVTATPITATPITATPITATPIAAPSITAPSIAAPPAADTAPPAPSAELMPIAAPARLAEPDAIGPAVNDAAAIDPAMLAEPDRVRSLDAPSAPSRRTPGARAISHRPPANATDTGGAPMPKALRRPAIKARVPTAPRGAPRARGPLDRDATIDPYS